MPQLLEFFFKLMEKDDKANRLRKPAGFLNFFKLKGSLVVDAAAALISSFR